MQDLIHALSSIKGVVAVGLGGSRGLGIANEDSDYDFVLFRDGGELLAAPTLVNAIKPFTGSEKIQDDAGFVRAQISGKKVDLFQKDLDLIEQELYLAKSGKFRWSIRQLFPHGDLSTCLISHIMYLDLCYEKSQCLSKLRKLAEPFPFLLMNSLINTFLTQSSITLIHARKIKKADDSQYLIALCSAFVFFSNIIIFTINKRYPVLEKGGSKIINGFSQQPNNYEQRISNIFKASVDGNLKIAISELSDLQEELSALATKCFSALKTVSSVSET